MGRFSYYMGDSMLGFVVFHNNEDKESIQHPLSFVLKEGFKHCFVILKTTRPGEWVVIDGTHGVPSIQVVRNTDEFGLVQWYENIGCRLLPVSQVSLKKHRSMIMSRPFVFSNCVGLVMMTLGMSGICLTPYSLYKRLAGT